MMVRAGSGWQTVLADLSLFLFMVAVSALSQAGDSAPAPSPRTPSPRAEPLAVWRDSAQAPPLADWLAFQSPDDRAQLTILAPYAPGRQAEALAGAVRLADAARVSGLAPRVVVEPGAGETTVTLAYDVPGAMLARGLQDAGTVQPPEQSR